MTATEFTRALKQYWDYDNEVRLTAIREYLESEQRNNLQALLRLVLKECEFMPTVATLRALCTRLPAPRVPLLPEPGPSAEEIAEGLAILGELGQKFRAKFGARHGELRPLAEEGPVYQNIVDSRRIKNREARRALLAEQARTLGVSV